MKVTSHVPMLDNLGNVYMQMVNINDILVQEPSILVIDGSTDNTGMAILRQSDSAIIASIAMKHEKQLESAVKYKVLLKREVGRLLARNVLIRNIFYEEPFIGYVNAAKTLLMLRTFVEELKFECEPALDYIDYKEINNMLWKKEWLAPMKVPVGTKAQKEAVREKLITGLPYLKDVTQDEVDCIAMGFVAITKLQVGKEDELLSKKKPTPFNYNVQFIGADDDEIAFQELQDICQAPRSIMENGIKFVTLKGRENWDKQIYSNMGQDDKLLVMRFPSDKFGNIVLEYRIGHLTNFQYIYGLVWRKNRKRA